VLLRVFVGGAMQPELADLEDGPLMALVQRELGELLGVAGEPGLRYIQRWQGAMPQYHLGHLERVDAIFQSIATRPGIEIAGNAYHGVGVPQCIASGRQAAERLLGRRTG
ncbi:MAG: FAD-dependent oxidoreductase, partial [Planctomycetales bacterium]|nr:FAD-dependent oxidoreductase [Planctomycetales bacterium]